MCMGCLQGTYASHPPLFVCSVSGGSCYLMRDVTVPYIAKAHYTLKLSLTSIHKLECLNTFEFCPSTAWHDGMPSALAFNFNIECAAFWWFVSQPSHTSDPVLTKVNSITSNGAVTAASCHKVYMDAPDSLPFKPLCNEFCSFCNCGGHMLNEKSTPSIYMGEVHYLPSTACAGH